MRVSTVFTSMLERNIIIGFLCATLMGFLFLSGAALDWRTLVFILLLGGSLFLIKRPRVVPPLALALFWFGFTIESVVFSTLGLSIIVYSPLFLIMLAGCLWQLYDRGLPRRAGYILGVYIIFLTSVFLALLLNLVSFDVPVIMAVFVYLFGGISFIVASYPKALGILLTGEVISSVCVSSWVIYCAISSNFGFRGGVDVNPNDVATIIGFGVCPAFAFMMWPGEGQRVWRFFLAVGIMGVQLYSMVLLASRGSTLACVGSVMAVMVARSKRPRTVLVSLLSLGVLVVGISQFPGAEYFLGRFGTQDDFSYRWPIWWAVLRAYADAPVGHLFFGNGLDSAGHVVSFAVSGLESTHNSYIQVLYEEGVIGLLAFLMLHTIMLKTLWLRRSEPLAAYAIGMVVFLMVQSCSASGDRLFEYWIVLGSVWFIAQHLKIHRSRPAEHQGQTDMLSELRRPTRFGENLTGSARTFYLDAAGSS